MSFGREKNPIPDTDIDKLVTATVSANHRLLRIEKQLVNCGLLPTPPPFEPIRESTPIQKLGNSPILQSRPGRSHSFAYALERIEIRRFFHLLMQHLKI